jgi:hypothetical protein
MTSYALASTSEKGRPSQNKALQDSRRLGDAHLTTLNSSSSSSSSGLAEDSIMIMAATTDGDAQPETLTMTMLAMVDMITLGSKRLDIVYYGEYSIFV